MMKFKSFIFGLFHNFIVFPVFITILFTVPTIQGEILVSPELFKKPSSNIILILTESTMPLINEISQMHFEDNVDKQLTLMQSLKHFTKESQAPFLEFLNLFSHLISIKPMWVDNTIFVEGAFPALIQLLLRLPMANKLKQIREQIVLKLPEVFNVKLQGTGPTVESPAWGVSKINCPQYWSKYGNGTGARVATIDTGCNVDHEALNPSYIGKGGWFDPNDSQTTIDKPTDVQGHGSHCMGSICGAHGTGCAPGAKWIACRGCGTAFCTEFDLCNCGQWLASCNNGQDGIKRCEHTPHVISCSWGGTDSVGNNFYDSYIAAWITCGIFPVFANGNSGPSCKTTGYPASNQQVCSVGATNITDQVSSFSSRGTTLNGQNMAPKCCAPGENILSCSNVGNGYKTMSGTSMATPHVAGGAALLKASCPTATPAQLEKALMSGANPNVGNPSTCNKDAVNKKGNECGTGCIDLIKSRETLAGMGIGCPLPP